MNIQAVIVGPIQVNCFIINCTDTQHAAIIDPGDDAYKILNVVQYHSLDVKYILLTHGHFDHIGAVADIKKQTNAEIVMHKADEFLIEVAPLQAASFGLPAPELFDVDIFINDGDELSFGALKTAVLHTPGHSPGGVCFKFENDLVAGDTLFYSGIGRTDFPGGDYDLLIKSIREKLFVLPDDMRVYCGHGPSTTIGREKKFNPFVH